MEEKSWEDRLSESRDAIVEGKKELQAMEELVRKDGYEIEKLEKEQLWSLLSEKEKETGKPLSEMALHVLVAGRCAGSYGCGTGA